MTVFCQKYFVWVFIVLITSCYNKPANFSLLIEGYQIQFPISSGELQKQYPMAKQSLSAFLTDRGYNVEVVWRFQNFVEDSRSQPYGVLIKLKDRGNKIDSIKSAFEKLYNQPFEKHLFPKHLSQYEYVEQDTSLRIMQINDAVQLSVSRLKIWPSGKYQFVNDVIVSICYDLDDEEKERFAMKQGDIRPRD